MNKCLEELKRLAYENACCRCQYYIDNKCTNEGECVWKTIEKELKEGEKNKQALEIIRREPSMVGWQAGYEDYEDYLDNTPEEQRFINNKEEFDLLKEVVL